MKIVKNKLFFLSQKEYKIQKREIVSNSKFLLGEVDGEKFKNDIQKNFYQEIGRAVDMPQERIDEINGNSMWFVDDMEDLWWHNDGEDYEGYYVAIIGGLKYLEKDYDYLRLLKAIIKFWTKDAERVVFQGSLRDFTVYLVESDEEVKNGNIR